MSKSARSRKSTRSTKSKQLSLFTERKIRKAHGGSLAVGKRRSKRPLNLKLSHHITMKSHHAIGSRSLFRHKKMILSLIRKNSIQFHVRVYESAIQGNHLHLLVKAQSREGLQNFFRVVAGHVAQRILKDHPLKPEARGGAPNQEKEGMKGGTSARAQGCRKNQRRFWSYLLYSRIVGWGREFLHVKSYIQKNTLEILQMMAYQPRDQIKLRVRDRPGV